MYNTCTATFNLFGLDSGLNAGNMHWSVEMQQPLWIKAESLNLKSASKYHQLYCTIQQQQRYIFRKMY